MSSASYMMLSEKATAGEMTTHALRNREMGPRIDSSINVLAEVPKDRAGGGAEGRGGRHLNVVTRRRGVGLLKKAKAGMRLLASIEATC